MRTIPIAVINASTMVTDEDAAKTVAALQTQVSRDFAPAWGVDAKLRLLPKDGKPAPGEWWLTLLDDADTAGALGYHDHTKEGLPLGKAFVKTSLKSHEHWSVTASHELLEMLADPCINIVAMAAVDGVQQLYSYEVCDACEGDEHAYKIDGVLVSNFVFPAWFEPILDKGSAQFDFMKHIDEPLKLLKGGYISICKLDGKHKWTQLDAELAETGKEAPKGSRRERRGVPLDKRVKSTVFGD